MPTERASIHVEASPEEVFDFVSDPWRIPEYVSLVLEILDVSEGPLGVGTQITLSAAEGVLLASFTPDETWRDDMLIAAMVEPFSLV